MAPWLPLLVVSTVAVLGAASWNRARRRRAARAARDLAGDATLPELVPKDRHLLLLMIDGLATEAFDEALAAGAMANLSRLLEQRPTLRMEAVSTFPSATAPSVPEMLSGRYVDLDELPAPGAVHAFDREQRRVVRYVTEPDAWSWPLPNLFDATRAAGLSAVTVFEGRWQGPEAILTVAAVSRAAALEIIGAGDLGSGGDRGPVRALLSRIAKRGVPRVALVVFNEADMKGHFHGPQSTQVRRALEQTDGLIAEILATLRAERTSSGTSVLDETTVVLFGDHGMVSSGRFLDLRSFFESRNLSVYDTSTLGHLVLRERLGSLWTRWPDVILVSGGSNIIQVYLRHPNGGWSSNDDVDGREKAAHERPDEARLARDLAELPGVGQVLRLDDEGTVEILAVEGRHARIVGRTIDHRRCWAYVVDDEATTDPLGYLDDERIAPLVTRRSQLGDASFLDADRWMEHTLHARYPGAVPLVPKAFHPQRFTGDLMVTSLPGWSFLRSQQGDHGNLERQSMLTPFVVNGPGIEHARAPACPRLVDLYPTAAVLLGAAADDPALADLDGRPLPGVRGP